MKTGQRDATILLRWIAPSVLLCRTVLPAVLLYWILIGGSVGHAAALLPGARTPPASGIWGDAVAYAAQSREPLNVSASEADSRFPAIAAFGSTLHVVWEESGRIYHRFCRDGVWSGIRSVAAGEEPAVAVDAAGTVHIVFANEFGDNYEVYYCRWNGTAWSLPRNVSNTSGYSAAPSLCIAPNGTLHVVWFDSTPGYNVIYHAYWDGRYWINEPIPDASGNAPVAAMGADGILHVVWQERDTPSAPYEVYHTRWNMADWSLPENLSDSPAQESRSPNIVVDGNNEAHVVWQEKISGRYALYYTRSVARFWSVIERISQTETQGDLPSAAVDDRWAMLYAGWAESARALYRQKGVNDVRWSQFTQVIGDAGGVADLQLAVDSNGQLHAAWTQSVGTRNSDVFYASLSYRMALPVVLRNPLP